MKNKLPPKKAPSSRLCCNKSDLVMMDTNVTEAPSSPSSSLPTTSQQPQQQDISSLLIAMSESRSSSPIALTTKPASGGSNIHNLHHQQLLLHHQHQLQQQQIGENLLPANAVVDQLGDHVAADALVNLSSQHASRQHAAAMANSAHQLPPACGAKQLSKLKRFLTTLVQFGRDLAPEICDRVRLLILALVNNLINVEEFHSKLQDLTGYPLRPFVIPFLKANLPLLQRELAHCARLARQTPQQFLLSNESLVYAPFTPNTGGGGGAVAPPSALSPANKNQQQTSPTPAEAGDLPDSPFDMSPFVHHQRSQQFPPSAHHRLRERSPDNVSLNSSRSSPANSKRIRSRSPIAGSRSAPHNNNNNQVAQQQTPNAKVAPKMPGDLSWIQASTSATPGGGVGNGANQTPTQQLAATQLPPPLTSISAAAAAGAAGILGDVGLTANEEVWRLLDQQLSALADAASNCRRSAVSLRERNREELLGVLARARIAGARLGVAGASQEVDEIRRRAEEAVNEIKRQACLELQRGVAAAEQKAREMVTAERTRMMRELADARQRGYDEAITAMGKQEETTENCANCGRSASERCSACEQVRYCGRFCQLHDWHRHRLTCRQYAGGDAVTSSRRSSNDGADQPGNKVDNEKAPSSSVNQPTNDNNSNNNNNNNNNNNGVEETGSNPGSTPPPPASQDQHQRRSKHGVKNESVSPTMGTPASSSSAGRSESRQSSTAASCH